MINPEQLKNMRARWHSSATDIPTLLDEVERLQTVIAGLCAAEAEFVKWCDDTGRYQPPEIYATRMLQALQDTIGAAFARHGEGKAKLPTEGQRD